MISGKMKILSAAIVAAALLATVSVARTVHTRATAVGAHATNGQATSGQATSGQAIGAAPGQMTPAPRHRNFACPMANNADCEKIEMLLPM